MPNRAAATAGKEAAVTDPAPLPTRQDAPRWLLLLIVVALLLAVGAGFVWIQSRPTMNHLVNQPATLGNQGPITGVDQILNEGVPANLVGREVVLEDVRVQQVVGEYTFWIGPSATRRIPVVLFGELTRRQPPSAANLTEGQQVRAFGVVRSMRDLAAFGTDPMVGPQELKRIHRRPVFVSVSRIMVSPE